MPQNSPVHSISEGIVVFSEWTSETGYVIIIEHLNGLTSIYKHNSSLVKSQGGKSRNWRNHCIYRKYWRANYRSTLTF